MKERDGAVLVPSPTMVRMQDSHALSADLVFGCIELKGRQFWMIVRTAEKPLHTAAFQMWRLILPELGHVNELWQLD